jgi:hypothetical protein
MLNQHDLDYLKWIAQRLVNRYREDPKILLVVDDIVSKINSNISVYKTYNQFVEQSVISCIRTLREVSNYNSNLSLMIDDESRKITIDKISNTFENINISEIIK